MQKRAGPICARAPPMSPLPVKQWPEDIGVPVEALIKELANAGISCQDADALVSGQDQTRLLEFLRESSGRQGGEVSACAIVR